MQSHMFNNRDSSVGASEAPRVTRRFCGILGVMLQHAADFAEAKALGNDAPQIGRHR